MYTTTVAAAFSLRSPSRLNSYAVVLSVAAGAVVGWPFSGAVGIPFAIKSLFFTERPLARLKYMVEGGLLSILFVAVGFTLSIVFFREFELMQHPAAADGGGPDFL